MNRLRHNYIHLMPYTHTHTRMCKCKPISTSTPTHARAHARPHTRTHRCTHTHVTLCPWVRVVFGQKALGPLLKSLQNSMSESFDEQSSVFIHLVQRTKNKAQQKLFTIHHWPDWHWVCSAPQSYTDCLRRWQVPFLKAKPLPLNHTNLKLNPQFTYKPVYILVQRHYNSLSLLKTHHILQLHTS